MSSTLFYFFFLRSTFSFTTSLSFLPSFSSSPSSCLSLPLSWVWTWGWAKSPERIEETYMGKNRKERKEKITHMSLTLLLLSLLITSLFSLCLSVWMISFEGEKRSSYWLALWKMQPAQPDPNTAHCERTFHLYHTSKSITPCLVLGSLGVNSVWRAWGGRQGGGGRGGGWGRFLPALVRKEKWWAEWLSEWLTGCTWHD